MRTTYFGADHWIRGRICFFFKKSLFNRWYRKKFVLTTHLKSHVYKVNKIWFGFGTDKNSILKKVKKVFVLKFKNLWIMSLIYICCHVKFATGTGLY